MPHQASFFPEDEPIQLPSANPGTSLALAHTETRGRKIESTRQAADTQRVLFSRRIQPLAKKRVGYMRQMALWLDGRLKQRGLTD